LDPQVLEKETVYLGGGSEKALVKMKTSELVRANSAKVVRVMK